MGSLSDLRLATACLLDFAGFLHFDELINLWSCDFKLQTKTMSIHIVHSKTDYIAPLRGQGFDSQDRNTTCPVVMLEQYLSRTDMPVSDEKISLPANSIHQEGW